MRTQHTLRYLLLRHLKRFDASVTRDRYVEVTRSLQVSIDGDAYVVAWQAGREAHEQRLPRADFQFYRQGDSRPQSRFLDDDLRNANDARARAFAAEVFGVPEPAPRTHADAPLEPFASWVPLEAVLFALAVGGLGELGLTEAALVGALMWIEQRAGGRSLASALWVLLAGIGPPLAALGGALVYGVLQFLDPDPTRRGLRVGLCAGAVWIAALHVGRVDVDFGGVLALAVAVTLAVFRLLHAAHFRALPLALPFFCAGLRLEGHGMAAWLGFAVLAASSALTAYGHRWWPVQREQDLTPNG